MTKIPQLLSQAKPIGEYSVICSNLGTLSAEDLKTLAQELVKHESKSVIVLASAPSYDRVAIACAVDPVLVKNGVNAGSIVKTVASVVGGTGGGRPDFAQAGGKYPDKIADALNTVWKHLSGGDGGGT